MHSCGRFRIVSKPSAPMLRTGRLPQSPLFCTCSKSTLLIINFYQIISSDSLSVWHRCAEKAIFSPLFSPIYNFRYSRNFSAAGVGFLPDAMPISALCGGSSGSPRTAGSSLSHSAVGLTPLCCRFKSGKPVNAFAGYFDGIGKVLVPFIGSLTHITLRVILSWLLIKEHGLSAVALATGLGWILVNVLWSVIYFSVLHPSSGQARYRFPASPFSSTR